MSVSEKRCQEPFSSTGGCFRISDVCATRESTLRGKFDSQLHGTVVRSIFWVGETGILEIPEGSGWPRRRRTTMKSPKTAARLWEINRGRWGAVTGLAMAFLAIASVRCRREAPLSVAKFVPPQYPLVARIYHLTGPVNLKSGTGKGGQGKVSGTFFFQE